MIQVKIQCGCGQPYAFDVEPVLNQMPSAVACPSCGADGTVAANAYLAQNAPAEKPVIVVPPPVRVPGSAARPAGSSATGATMVSHAAPELDPEQVKTEARARILWGDAPEEVVKHLIIKGVDADHAAAVVQVMLKERTAAIRVKGLGKMGMGAALVAVPIATVIMFMQIGATSFTLLGIAGAIGLWGAWMMLKGVFMLLAPKSEAGDVEGNE